MQIEVEEGACREHVCPETGLGQQSMFSEAVCAQGLMAGSACRGVNA